MTTSTGAYTANLLGTIRSHLAALQGFDVMALELLQNADDAKAEEVVFNITDQALEIRNSAEFTYCGDLKKSPCPWLIDGSPEGDSYACDFHRIIEVASGGKLSRPDNIGRFGVGFISCYQITDRPEIKSAGCHLILEPELQQWKTTPINRTNGTQFVLKWARDATTSARRALGGSAITQAHIDELTTEVRTTLERIRQLLPHLSRTPVIFSILSPLAEGADRLVVRR